MYDNKEPVTGNISNSETQQDTPTYKPWVWYGMYRIKAAGRHHKRARVSGFGEEALRGITYLTTF